MGKRTGKNRKTDGRAGYGKRVAAVGMMFVMLFSFAACGKTTASEEAEALSGSCIDILNKVYETADLDASMRDAMQDYEMTTIDADMEEYVLGTDEITYTDSAYSAPMMTSVAYQCVVRACRTEPMCRRQNRRFWTMPILQNGSAWKRRALRWRASGM